jgi:hypothetical protein
VLKMNTANNTTRSSEINVAVIQQIRTMARIQFNKKDVSYQDALKNVHKMYDKEVDHHLVDTILSDVHAEMNTEEINSELSERETIKATKKPMDIILDAYKDVHCGDRETMQAVALAFCATRETTNNGIQPKGGGKTGSGKTSSFESAVYCLPQDKVRIGTMSNKALLYDTSITDGTMFLIDDAQLPPDIVAVFKSSMSRFQEPYIYTSVKVGRDGVQSLTIPKRCVYMFTSVGDLGDEQLVNRFLGCNIDRTENDIEKISKFYADKDIRGEPVLVETQNVKACRELLSDIGSKTFTVMIPDAARINWRTRDVRIMRAFITIMKAHCVLNYRDRVIRDMGNNHFQIDATKEDFDFVYLLSFFKNRVVAESHLTTQEEKVCRMLVKFMPDGCKDEYQVLRSDLVKAGNSNGNHISQAEITWALSGRDSGLGLVHKIPGFEVEDLTTTSTPLTGELTKEHKRGKVITVPVSIKELDCIDSCMGVASWI